MGGGCFIGQRAKRLLEDLCRQGVIDVMSSVGWDGVCQFVFKKENVLNIFSYLADALIQRDLQFGQLGQVRQVGQVGQVGQLGQVDMWDRWEGGTGRPGGTSGQVGQVDG